MSVRIWRSMYVVEWKNKTLKKKQTKITNNKKTIKQIFVWKIVVGDKLSLGICKLVTCFFHFADMSKKQVQPK